jgi:hypothetical protein
MEILNKISVRDRVNYKSVAGDIASPADGDIWYNSDTGKFRKKQNGVSSDLSPFISPQAMFFVAANRAQNFLNY